MSSMPKWTKGLGPETPARKAGRRMLRARLKAVEKAVLRLRKREPSHDEKETERVHALRVATRRGTAAVRAVKDLLGDKPAKRTSKWLKALRHAASAARDCDVHRDALSGMLPEAPEDDRPALPHALERLGRQEGADTARIRVARVVVEVLEVGLLGGEGGAGGAASAAHHAVVDPEGVLLEVKGLGQAGAGVHRAGDQGAEIIIECDSGTSLERGSIRRGLGSPGPLHLVEDVLEGIGLAVERLSTERDGPHGDRRCCGPIG